MENRLPSPEVRAEFLLDEKGIPRCVVSRGLKHYKIRLYIEELPTELVDTAVYDLHSSYYDPKREVTAVPGQKESQFPEEITSYGDFAVTVAVSGPAGQAWKTCSLADALEHEYRNKQSPAIQHALNDIRNH